MKNSLLNWQREHIKGFWYKSVSPCCESVVTKVKTDKLFKSGPRKGSPVYEYICDNCGVPNGVKEILMFDSGTVIGL